ncbi:hypothetical protein [Mycobacterium sp. 236(2023)]|uniref:hypothetical protein n=1 Tax=Mycobacterium sp. 236(2023) TaxID=3038163 RepID=UPI002414D051|nr:hypothetical protein [Mycobacterium sp. 236(2023)]MDG4668228.1 hypothetical protein [Mycobacterium sp. 236(2023)]
MGVLTSGLDLSTRYFWRTIGRPVDVESEHRWLDSPHTARGGVGDDWLTALERDGHVRQPDASDGLMESMAALDGPHFTASRLKPLIRDFYEHTASWRMEVWSQWNALFAPGGELIARVWGRRVEQLALPIQPLSVSRGMSSVVRVVEEEDGSRAGAAWLRNLRSDGSRVYSGYYRVGRLPANPQPHVYVSFPLESGSVQVYLTPRNDPDGSFWLESRSRTFGGDGAYSVVRFGDRWFASLTPLRETFHVFVDDEGVLRTDHWLRIGRWQALRLHYRLDRAGAH